MEGLLCILVELITAPIALISLLAECSLFSGLASLITTLIELVLLIVGKLVGRRLTLRRQVEQGAPPPPARPPRRWLRWLLFTCLGLLVLVLGAIAVVSAWFTDDLLRWALARQERQSGIHVECERIDASLFSGRCELSGIHVTRHGHPAGDIELTARTAVISLSLWSAWEPTVPIRSLHIDGLRGHYELGKPPVAGAPDEETDGRRSSPDLERKPRRQFVIADLEITDLALDVTDHTRRKPLQVPITITRLNASPMRSKWALFDVLFRSSANGTLAGKPFTIASSGDNHGRKTVWSVSDLPVEVLTTMIGGPFSLITQGRCDVHVVDRWQLVDQTMIDMDWNLTLHDVHAEVPPDLTGLRHALAVPVVALLNASPEQVPLGFSVHIDRNRFEGASTLEAAGMWKAVDEALTRKLAEKTGIAPEKLDQLQKSAVDVGKDLLERWRKSKK